MTQNNIYMEDNDMKLYIDVQPLFIDALENSKNEAVASAQKAAQSEANAKAWKNDIIDYKTSLELFYSQASDGITNLYNNLSSDLSTIKNSAAENLQTLKNNIQNTLNNSLNTAINSIRTFGQSYINQAQEYAEQARDSVDNRVSIDHLNQSKALESGNISTDTDVLKDIINYAHSTYCGDQTEGSTPGYLPDGVTPLDPKKFIKVGSPNITDDGIASGFSQGSCVKVNYSLPTTSNFKIKLPFKLPSTSTSSALCKIGNIKVFYRSNDKDIVCNSQEDYAGGQIIIGNNNEFYLEITNDIANSRFVFKGFSKNGTQLGNTQYYSTWYNDISSILLGGGYYLDSFKSDIDLKGVNISVDGIPVFSGNKTGIDTIKPDDYTIPANNYPTITDDGIVTFWNKDNTIKYLVNENLNSATNYKIHSRILTPLGVFDKDTSNTLSECLYISNSGNNPWSLFFYTQNHYNFAFNGVGYTWRSIGDINTSIKYLDIEIKNDGTSFIITIYKPDGTVFGEPYTSSISGSNLPLESLSCGITRDSSNVSTATPVYQIDLNSIKVYVNGKLVYLPCLKIPFTESKTGSKIVSFCYHKRVAEMYELYGYAPYYTIGENKFTLPMGEIYGMFEKLRQLIIQRTS